MKVSLPQKIYLALLAVILTGVAVHAPLSVWLGTIWPEYLLLIKAWKEIIMIAMVPLAFGIVARRRVWRELIDDRLLWGIVGFMLLHVLLIPFNYQGVEATLAGLAIDLRYFLFFGLVHLGIKIMPKYREVMIKAGLIGAIIVVGFATIQLFLPADILSHIGYDKYTTIAPYQTLDENPAFIRENSTLRGPNPLGAYAVIVLGMLSAVILRMRARLEKGAFRLGIGALAVCSLVALWVSYSRSALVAAGVAIIAGVAGASKRNAKKSIWIVSGVLLLALIGGIWLFRDTNFVSNVILHVNPNGGSVVSSNDDHASSLTTGIYQLVHQPFGAGIGSTGSASLLGGSPTIIENQYLFVAHEAGWIGAGLFVLIWTVVLSRLWHRREDWLALGLFAGGLGLAVICLLLPALTDDTISIVWWGLAAIIIGGKNSGRTTKQKATRAS